MAVVSYREASRIYPGQERPAVDRLSLEVRDGEFLVLVGPSGCGKSTALRMVAGLEPLDDGSIHIGDRDVTDLAPKDRDVAMIFQNYALYPHMTVAENIGFHLRIRRVSRDEIDRRVRATAEMLDLVDFLDRKPAKLSGGQRQRVAMGRAIVREPSVFLMDEPLSNLDAKLRVQTRTQVADLQKRLGTTTVYVTHDQVEAMTMGDRVAVMRAGVLQQVASPRELFTRPVNTFVAGFIGSPAMNLLHGALQGDDAVAGALSVRLTPSQKSALTTSAVTIGVRPEGWQVGGTGLAATVDIVEDLGSDCFLHCTAVDATRDRMVVRVEGLASHDVGRTLHLAARPGAVHLFDTESGQRLPD
jgi:multiple sugar transport system ATP-binding protein